MPIYRGTGGSTPLNDNVTEDEVGLLLSRFDTLASELERQTGVVATDLAQAVTAANQAVTDTTQQKLFAQAAAQEASGYAVDAFFARDAAQTSETNAAQSAAEAAASAASVDAANLARIDQSNTFTGPQVVVPDPSDPTNDALLTLQADPDNTEDNANPVLRLQQDGDLAQFHVTMSTGTDGELRTVNKATNNVFNDLLFRQQDKAGVLKTPMIIDSNQNVQIVEGALQVKTGNIDTASANPLSLKVNGERKVELAPDKTNHVGKQVLECIPQTGLVFEAIDSEAIIGASDLGNGGNRGLRYQTRDFGQHRFLVSGNARMTISSGGVTVLNNFNVDQNTTLNGDLTVDGNIINAGLPVTETGTWTPVLVQSNGSSIAVGSPSTTGVYTKVGKLVTVSFQYSVGSWVEGAGINKITGLPFPANSTFKGSNAFFSSKVSLQSSAVIGLTIPDSSDIVLRTMRSDNSGTAPVTGIDDSIVSLTMQGTLTYETN